MPVRSKLKRHAPVKWIRHNKDCIKTKNEMVCRIETRTKTYYTTYTINKGVIIPTHREYETPKEAKRAILAGVI